MLINDTNFKNVSMIELLLRNGFTPTDLMDDRRFKFDSCDVFAAIIKINLNKAIRTSNRGFTA